MSARRQRCVRRRCVEPWPDRAGRLCGRAAAALLCGLLILSGGARPALRALVATCHADADDESADLVRVPSRVRIVNGRTELVLSAAAVRNAGIATAHPVPAQEQTGMQAYGQVLDAAVLSDLASRYRNAAAQAASARAKAGASRAALARVRSLYLDRRNMSAAQLQSAESAYRADEASLTAARAGLSALGADIEQHWGPVLAAAVMHDGPLLRELVARRQFLVSVTLPSGAAPGRAPRTASAQVPGGPQVSLALVSPATAVDPLVQGLRYYYRAPAAAGLLAGLHLPVTLEAPGGSSAALVIPESAVIWLQGKPWVYRLLGGRVYARELIDPERQAADGGYVVRGLPRSAEIVVRGAQLLLSEEFRAQVERHADD